VEVFTEFIPNGGCDNTEKYDITDDCGEEGGRDIIPNGEGATEDGNTLLYIFNGVFLPSNGISMITISCSIQEVYYTNIL
tara:strand:+ start:1064 stop:1303 length:240 start_codon:yes stop_codon:yes gene_type:complete